MLYVYGLYDKKLGEYGPQLNCEKNSLTALRNLGDVVKRIQESPLAIHAEDFDLMCLGELDEQTGVLTPYPTMRFVENVGNLVKGPAVKGLGLAKEA